MLRSNQLSYVANLARIIHSFQICVKQLCENSLKTDCYISKTYQTVLISANDTDLSRLRKQHQLSNLLSALTIVSTILVNITVVL